MLDPISLELSGFTNTSRIRVEKVAKELMFSKVILEFSRVSFPLPIAGGVCTSQPTSFSSTSGAGMGTGPSSGVSATAGAASVSVGGPEGVSINFGGM